MRCVCHVWRYQGPAEIPCGAAGDGYRSGALYKCINCGKEHRVQPWNVGHFERTNPIAVRDNRQRRIK